MAFERFTKTGKSFVPKLSIRRTGQLGFNQGAVDEFKMANFEYMVLFFDSDNNKIGVKLTNDVESGACKLRVRDGNASISAKAFLDCYGINYTESSRYLLKWDEEAKLLVAEME